jgi:apolipoprotein N-acyltransferase
VNARLSWRPSSGQSSWACFLLGCLVLPFTAYQGVIALAAWLAPVFLLRFTRSSDHGRRALLLVFLAYAAAAILGGRGTSSTGLALVSGLVAFPILQGIMYVFPYAADRVIGRRLGTWARLLVFPAALVAAEWLFSIPAITGTFGAPAYSQYGDLPLMQLASVTGMWGITFLIGWFASTVNAAWEHDFRGRGAVIPMAACAVVLGSVFAFGGLRLALSIPASPTLRVATVTADGALVDAATADIDWATFYRSTDAERAVVRAKLVATVDVMLARTEVALKQGAKLVAWQEDAIWVLAEDRQSIIDRAAGLARRYDAYLDITMGVFSRTSALPYLGNQSIMLDPTGAVLWTYQKTHPVFPNEAILTLPGSQTLPTADTPDGRWSSAICNDTGYPALEHQAGAKGVDLLIVPTHGAFSGWDTNDAAEVTYRGIEDGFVLVRPTGNGPTLITDPEGRIIASQDYTGAGAILMASVPTHGVATVYGRLGDWFAYLCLLIVGGMFVLATVPRRQARLVPGIYRPD